MNEFFATPLRSAALGVLIVLFVVIFRGLVYGRHWRPQALLLSILALGMVVLSEHIQ